MNALVEGNHLYEPIILSFALESQTIRQTTF